jgi:hypothetical protein
MMRLKMGTGTSNSGVVVHSCNLSYWRDGRQDGELLGKVADALPSMCKALGLIPSVTKKKKKREIYNKVVGRMNAK